MEEASTPPKEEKKKIAAVPMLVQDGEVNPRDFTELQQMIAHVAAGGGFPERFDNHAKRVAAYNLAHSLMGGRWQLALNNIAIIKGQMTIYGELPGAVAEQTKEVAEKEVYCLTDGMERICVSNQNIDASGWAGVCIIQRKGRSRKEFTYTLDEAKAAGQYPAKRKDGSINNDAPWMKFTKVMLMRKAMAMAIKFEFPDAMIGVPVAEYDYDLAPDLVKDVTPGIDRVNELNARFSSRENQNESTVRQQGPSDSEPRNSQDGGSAT